MNEEEIIRRILEGETELFEQLVKRYHRLAYARALGILLRHEDAEEITQESFISAYIALATLRDRGKFAHWLSGIVRRKAIYFLRKKGKKGEFIEGLTHEFATNLEEGQSDNGPENAHVAEERERIIVEELAKLPDKYREVIYMRFYKNFTYQEIADFLGLTKSGVDTRLQRARSMLEHRLKARGMSYEM